MRRRLLAAPMIPAALLLQTMIGCRSENDRLVEMAEQYSARQAESQRQMAELHRQLMEGSRQLVERDARAREELTALQHDLRGDQAEVGRQRDQLEADRREIAQQRHRDPLVAAAIMNVGLVLACLLPLAVCVYVLWSARREGESDAAVAELLVQELVASEPRLLPRDRGAIPRVAPEAEDQPPGGDPDRQE